ncbi:MAG: class I SAM-dependent methyltransferase [Nitrosarchaeum sp.]|nr:class I SAM-dependent methyltransferase [Nitrosarchaeum sp.]MBP0119695.1 class I SAM-dependent methyltransferase [Nitrosarchaeum sp.]MBP0133409.1 class I SAM-dependent methyltransferase [Nitrosarchaeum sp.]
MDPVTKTFDKWAKNGRAEHMEKEHGKNVKKFLETVHFNKSFTFLDFGCGNGWVVRMIAKEKLCKKVIGIDKSKNMIIEANKKKTSIKEKYINKNIESFNHQGKYDYIFSMESLYYVDSINTALKKIYKLLKPGGKFFCGIDFYTDNVATIKWANIMKIQMHLHSKQKWRKFFKSVGFETKTRHVRDLKNKKKWKREFGTLFITGYKPK